MLNPISRQNRNPWDDNDDPLWLLTPEELHSITPGTTLTDIHGKRKTFLIGDVLDDDTRFGYTAYGVRESELNG